MKTFARILLLPLLALIAAGCSDLGLGTGAGEVVGLTIEDAGGNTVASVASSGAVSGTVTVPRFQQRELRVVLRGAGGVVTPALGDVVRVTITNTQVASWMGEFDGAGTLTGSAAGGTTSMRVDLISGGTAVYTSPAITVQVS
jgi:acetamidase/formamidase